MNSFHLSEGGGPFWNFLQLSSYLITYFDLFPFGFMVCQCMTDFKRHIKIWEGSLEDYIFRWIELFLKTCYWITLIIIFIIIYDDYSSKCLLRVTLYQTPKTERWKGFSCCHVEPMLPQGASTKQIQSHTVLQSQGQSLRESLYSQHRNSTGTTISAICENSLILITLLFFRDCLIS